MIIVTGDANPTGGGGWVRLQIYRDGTAIGKSVQVEQTAGNLNAAYCVQAVDTPSAGTYTYSMQTVSIGGTFDFGEVDPPTMTIIELTGAIGPIAGSNTQIIYNNAGTAAGSANLTWDGTYLNTPYLRSTNSVGDEGGELSLAKPATNTNISGGVVIDVYQNRLRFFETGGSNRGAYIDISSTTVGVGTPLIPTIYLLEAYANVTYTLPGGYTDDPCRYSIVSNTVNVPNSWFNTTTHTFTPQKSGYWQITAAYDIYRSNEASMIIKKNGSNVAVAGSIDAVVQQITKIIYLNGSTDYINIINVGASASSRTQNESKSWFQARWVGV